MGKIRIGISSCLLGFEVRHNGGHCQHSYIKDVLNEYFDYVPICPELAAGMGVPRPTVRLVQEKSGIRMIAPKTGIDWTDAMQTFSTEKAASLDNISGYIFKQNSPSCGLFRVKLHHTEGHTIDKTRGLYANTVTETWPLMPVEEEGRLNDAPLRENFLARVFAYDTLKQRLSERFSRATWVQFHQDNKFQLLSHSRKYYQELGRLVAHIADFTPDEFKQRYAETYMRALTVKTTAKKHTDVLMHLYGFLKKQLDAPAKADLLQVIEDYRQEIHPLIVPITLLKHYFSVYQIPYAKTQTYLNPHPAQLGLRNRL